MCTARNFRPPESARDAAAAASRAAESAPPLKATISPVAPAGTWASRTARRVAAEKLMGVYVSYSVERGVLSVAPSIPLRVPEYTEGAQARLARVQQLRDRLIAKLRQRLEHALLDGFRHGLGIAMRAAMRLLQDFVDQA